ncbi:NlpC/P60 family protein [Nocardioides exalbidus]|uniref:NlpC/P60 family protein n=1 Tax=Nocardioides exalbidus TaxID=402596 RepID=A0A1H4JR13_9ACTN|nr:C40 family peptidase [Nocardioides exalbidus]SEB48042.1 NlpC/P60 family protein [Nocardioides exalbidus]
MPAISRTARAGALALAGLGLTASTMVALPATAAPTGTDASPLVVAKDKHHQSAKDRKEKRERRAAERLDTRVLGALGTAMRQRGDAYSYGAAGPNAFDCSGLVYYSYRRAGFPVPRTSGAQAGYTSRVAKRDMRPGDLMFFHGSGGVYHAAVFLRWVRGHALMVHAPGSGQRVQVAVPWTSSWFGGTLRR